MSEEKKPFGYLVRAINNTLTFTEKDPLESREGDFYDMGENWMEVIVQQTGINPGPPPQVMYSVSVNPSKDTVLKSGRIKFRKDKVLSIEEVKHGSQIAALVVQARSSIILVKDLPKKAEGPSASKN